MVSFFKVLAVVLTATLDCVTAQTSGCGKSPPASGTKNIGSRQYILQVPNNYDPSRQYKLIFGFHWLNGNMNNVAPGFYGLPALAGNSAIFVAPNGINAGWANGGGSDLAFVDQILDQVQSSLCVDTTQRFATGFSYGGAMSYALACDRSNIFRSVSVIAGAQLSGCANGQTPVPYLGIHGSADNVLAISNGRTLRDRFLQLNGCQSKNAPEPSPGASGHIKTEYSCRAGFPVTWIAHGGGHVGDASENGVNYFAAETWKFWTALGSGTNPPVSSTSTQSSVSTQTSKSPEPTGGTCSAKWGQCGGDGWNGPTCCQSGSTCKAQHQYYSQCI